MCIFGLKFLIYRIKVSNYFISQVFLGSNILRPIICLDFAPETLMSNFS